MNFEESNQFVEEMEKNNKKKKSIIAAIIVIAVIILLLIIAINYIRNEDAKKLKMYIDDKQISISSTLLTQDSEGNNYMNVRELAELLGYSYQNGEYKNYNEDSDSCYLKTPYEIVSMTADSETLTKYILNDKYVAPTDKNTENSNNNDKTEDKTTKQLIIVNETTGEQSLNIVVNSENEAIETFALTDTIQLINDELYVPFTELARVFSVNLNTSTPNRIRINTIPSLAVSVSQIATNLGYQELSNVYENLTAIVDGMMIVGDGTNYGVVSLETGDEIISLKYDKIIYHQNTQEFFVTAENSVGIINKDGKTIVKPTDFDAISSYDELNNLYLVEKDGKYGIVNRKGETIIYAEYDSVGLENAEEFENEDIRSFNLLFENSIPVNSNGKVGLFDIEGNEKLKCVYNSLGFVQSDVLQTTEDNDKNKTTSSRDDDDDDDNNENQVANNTTKNNTTTKPVEDIENVLIIPESLGVKGIVVNLNGLYGLYDAEAGRLIIPCACSKIYAKRKAGVTKYYLEYNEQEIDLEDYLEQNQLISVTSSNDKEQEKQSERTEEDNTENTTSNKSAEEQ